ncbi:MAG TPA: BatD family protein [Flavobacteriales bacterium]|nr:BatD family protein [Flavobacteriales bacterium]
MMRRTLLLLLAGLTWPLLAAAQEITFDARVDRTSFEVGASIRLTITLANAQGSFSNPDLGGLTVVQGPFESSSFNYVNGRMSSTVSRTYVITATRPGTYTIGPASARVGGGTLQTQPITVKVEKGSGATSDRLLNEGQQRDRDLFVTISLSKSKVHVGEQVVATYTLFSRYPNLELSKYDLPALNGFWAEEIDRGETTWEDQLRTVNGLQYRVAVLKKQLLFPQRAGTLRIEPLRITCVVNRSFFNRGSQVEAMSNATELQVLPLPPNAPPGMQGAVGSFSFSGALDRDQLRADEALELTLTVNGSGNLKLIEAPALDLPPDVERYDPKVNDRISISGNGMSGSRSFTYLLIPRHAGELVLGPFALSFFDVQAGAYRTVQAGPFTVQVTPGSGSGQAQLSRPSKADVEVLDTDIRFLRTGDLDLRPAGHHLLGSWAWWSGMAAPVLAFAVFLVWRRREDQRAADPAGRRRREADKVARRRFKDAHDALKRDAREPFYTAMNKALHGYLGDRFGLGAAELNAAALERALGERPDAAALARQATDLIAACDMARYAPLEVKPRQAMYEEAITLVQRLERP